MEEKYIYNGFEYTLSEIQSAAQEKGVSLDQYISDNNIQKIEKEESEKFYNFQGYDYSESEVQEAAENEGIEFEDYISKHNIQGIDEVGSAGRRRGMMDLTAVDQVAADEVAAQEEQEDMMNLFEDLRNPFADEDKIVSRFEEKFGDEFEVTNPTSIGYNQVKLKSKSTGREHNVYDPYAEFGTGGASYDQLVNFIGTNSSSNADKNLIQIYQKSGVKADNEGKFDMYKEVPLMSESGGTISTDTEEVLMTDDEIIQTSTDAQNEIVNNILSKGYKFLPDLYNEEEKDEAGLTDNELEKLNDDVYNNLRAKGHRISRDSYDEMLESSKFKNLVNDRLQKRRDDIVKKNSRDAYGGLDQATSADIEQDFNQQSEYYIQVNPNDGEEVLELNKKLAQAESVIIQYGSSSELTTEQQQQLTKARTDYNNAAAKLKELKSDLNVNDAWVDEAMLSDSEKEEVKKAQENAIKTAQAQQAIEKRSGSTTNSVKQLYKDAIYEEKGLLHMGDQTLVDVNTAGGGNMNRIIYDILKARGEDVTIDQSAQQKRNQQLTMMQQVDPQGAGNIGMIFQGLTGRGSTYLLDRNGKRINNVKISFNELLSSSTNYRDFQGFADESMFYLSESDRTAFKDWNLEINKNRAERKGYWEVAYAGTTPERIGNPIRDIESVGDVPGYLYDAGKDLSIQAVRAAGSSWFDMGPEEVYKYGETKRDKLTHIQNTVNLINNSEDVISGKVAEIKFDDKDKKALEMGYTETTTTAVGGFLPTLAEFTMFELATGGTATPAALARLGRAIEAGKKVNKITKLVAGTKGGRFVAGALREEIKMQANTADFGLGTGTFFFGFGKALSAIKIVENPALANLTNRYFTKGASGAMSIEADQLVHGFADELLDNKDFNDTMSELYGDEDEVFKRVVANTLMFQLTGVNAKENIFTDVFTQKGRSQFAFSKNAKLRTLQKLRDKAGMNSNGLFKYNNGRFEDGIDASTGTVKEIFDKLSEAEIAEIESQKTPLAQLGKFREILFKKPELTKLQNKLISNTSLQYTLEQRLLVENEANSLDPYVKGPNGKYKLDSEGNKIINDQFERDFRAKAKTYFDAVRTLGVFRDGVNKASNPIIGMLKTPEQVKRFLSEGETAKWVPEDNTIYLDLNKYTPGKAMHEFTHVMLDAYFEGNPTAKENFINKMEAFAKETAGMRFSHSERGDITGKELMDFIKENYKGKESQGEEYFTYMMELAADPMVAATNPYLAGSLTSRVLENVRGIQGVFTKNRQTGLKNKSEVLKTVYNLSKSIYKGKLDARTEKRLRKLALSNTKVNDNISSVLEIQEGIGDKKQSDLASQYASEIAATKKPPKTKGKGKASKDIDRIFLDVGDPFGNRTNEEVVGVNEKINESIKKGAREAGVTPFEYKQRNPEYVGALYANNLKLVSEMMKKYQEKFEFNSSVDKEAFRAAISKSLEDYARRYGNTKFLKEKQGETKEQFEARKKGVENLDSYFYDYAKKGIQQQLKGNIQVQAGMSYKEGNKIIPLTRVTGEAKERLFEGLETTESASQIRKREFNEGLTDMTGNIKLDPIKTIPSRVQSNISEAVANRVKDIDFKTADLTTANMPDLTNAANEIFGVKQSKITDKDGALKPNTTRLSGGELSSFQKTVFGEKGIGLKNFYTVWHNGYLKEGARAGESTMIQPVLLKEFYKDATIKRPNGDTWAAKEKLPFSEVEAKLKEFFGLKQDGTFETIKENTKLDARAKAGVFQYLKSISRAETNKWLDKNKPEGYENFALNIQGGKPKGVASKDMFADRLGNNIIDPNTKRLMLAKLGKAKTFDANTMGLIMLGDEFVDRIGVLERQSILKDLRLLTEDPANQAISKKVVEEITLKSRNEKIRDLIDEGYDLEIATEIAKQQDLEMADLYKKVDLDLIVGSTRRGGEGSEILKDVNFKEFTKNGVLKLVEKLDLEMLEKEAPEFFKSILPTIGAGVLKNNGITSLVGKGYLGKASITGSSKTSGAETIKKLLEKTVDDFKLEDLNVDKEYTKKLIEEIKYAYQPAYNTSKNGNLGKAVEFAKEFQKTNNALELADKSAIFYSHPDLIKQGYTPREAFDITEAANKKAKEFYDKGILKMSNGAALMFGQINTSSSKGGPRGFTTVKSVTTKPELGKNKDGRTVYNEHAREQFNAFSDVFNIKLKDVSIEQKAAEAKILSDEASQHVISKSLQEAKDATGYIFRTSFNDLLQTYVKKGSMAEQVILGGPEHGKLVSEGFVKTYGKEIAKELIKNINEKSPSSAYEVKRQLEYETEIKQVEANNNKEASIYDVYVDKASKDPFGEALDKMTIRDKANVFSNKKGNPIKKIRVFDFDDTLATSKNIVIARKDGKEVKLNAEQFAKEGLQMKEKGWEMDFSDFNKVTEGGRGPLFDVAKKIKEARGNEDLFVLTARAPEAAPAIFEFLKAEGLEFKRENIIGLGNSTGEAKASWLIGKVSEGYNDFYFADDAYQNVKAVKDAIANYDVKSKIQQAKASLDLNTVFNKILEDKSGIEYFKEFSEAKAKALGARKNKFQFYVPYSAEDFEGLLYATLAKGKRGEMQMDFYRENLLNPYSRAMNNLAKDRIQLMSDFKALKKQLDVPKDLKKVNESGFTNEQAVRVYLFNKSGHEMKDLSKRDLKELLDIVESDGKLKAFADKILEITKGDGYAKPKEGWLAGTITTDLVELLNTTKRSKYLQQWRNNVDEMFSKKNLNKLEAIFGSKYREALESSIARMKSGRNRLETGNRLSNQMLDYINGSNAAIMFFNTRSAVLQTISAANFINWTFNNPIMAGKAFANQKQYWKDFMELMNSDYLVDRRNGQKINISEAEITNAAATAKNKAKAVMAYILQKGYLPTQYADSFAIASGGATYFRNRINNLRKQGVSEAEARNIAYTEFKELSEKSQQSSDPSKISQQQSSDYGRLILMFANTPMQYTRLQKRAIQDLINGRGSAKANVSKIMYYGFIQNLMFNALQQAVFAIGFGDDKMDENDEKKINRTVNGMLDSTLRGMGVGGATVSVLKNFLLDVYERSGRNRPEYVDAVWKLTQISPPIGSKISRIKSALYAFDNKQMREQIQTEGISLDNPALMASAQVISATTNVPLDRVLQKIENLRGVVSDDAELWQRIAMLAGWPSWTFEDKKETKSKSKSKSKKKTKVIF